MRISFVFIIIILAEIIFLGTPTLSQAWSAPLISRNTRSVEDLCPTNPALATLNTSGESIEVLPSGREIRRLYDELSQDGTRRQNMERHIDDALNDYEQIFINVLQYEQARRFYAQYMRQNKTEIIVSVAVTAGLLYLTAGSANVVLNLAKGSPLLLTSSGVVVGGVTNVLFQATLKTADFARLLYRYKKTIPNANLNVTNTHNEILDYKSLLNCYYGLIARRTNAGLNAFYDVNETLYVRRAP